MAVAPRSINSSTVTLCNSSYEASWAFAGTDAALGQRLCRVQQFMSNWLGFVLWMLWLGLYSKTHNTLHSLLTTLLCPGEAKNKTCIAKCSCLCFGSRLLWKQSHWWRFIFCLVLRQESCQKCVHVLLANVISLVCSVMVMVKIQPTWCFFGHTDIPPLPWPYSLSGYINGYSWCVTLTTGCVMLFFSAESQKDAQSPQSTYKQPAESIVAASAVRKDSVFIHQQ